jgi:hypothetical protein
MSARRPPCTLWMRWKERSSTARHRTVHVTFILFASSSRIMSLAFHSLQLCSRRRMPGACRNHAETVIQRDRGRSFHCSDAVG